MRHNFKFLTISVATICLTACAAKQPLPGAERVELVNTQPNIDKCQYLGEVAGTQGNWFTGDLTPNKNLVIGARNELRNEAFKLGANIVYVQDLQNTNSFGSLGTTNTTGIGKAYKCNF